ncbi:MAG: polyhydroxyalkanoate synthesis regulator DNA-binding domain-containing protein [Desulfobacteraceae bacterium]|jgi:polyhydroxyalkanoate synthesis repressor PhaR
MAERVLFKKYANRRLYDTEKSTYVTLNHVADIIKEGRQVEVIDAKTKEDVTAFILTQIVLEESRKKNVLLPVPLLHLIIQYGENVLEEFFEKYLQQTIHNYLNYKKTVDEQFGKWLEVGMDLTDMAQKTMTGLTPFQSFFDQFSSSGDKEEDKQGG